MNLVLNRIPPFLRFICTLPLYLYDGVAWLFNPWREPVLDALYRYAFPGQSGRP